MLSKGAFNALLKTLEEPPEHVKFIFATTEVRKVPVTVLSRCQRFDLRRVGVPDLTKHFAGIVENEGAAADEDGLRLIARAAEGSVRDGLSILDQAIAMGSGHVGVENVRAMLGLADRGRVFDLFETMLRGDTAEALGAFEALHADGADPLQVLNDLAEVVHLTTKAKIAGSDASGETVSAEEAARTLDLSAKLSIPLLSRIWQMLLKGIDEVNGAPSPVTAAEMVLIRITHTADLPTPDELIKALGDGGATQSRPASGANGGASEPGNGPAAHATDRAVGNLAPVADAVPRNNPSPTTAALPQSLEDVAAFVGQQRDAMLRVHIEEHMSLIALYTNGDAHESFHPPTAPQAGRERKAWRARGWRRTAAECRCKRRQALGRSRFD